MITGLPSATFAPLADSSGTGAGRAAEAAQPRPEVEGNDASVRDRFSRNPVQSRAPLRLLMKNLPGSLGMGNRDQKPYGNILSPGSMAGKLISSLNNGLRSTPPAPAFDLLSEAADGVGRGAQAAKEQLAGLGALDAEAEGEIDRAADLMNQGLEGLRSSHGLQSYRESTVVGASSSQSTQLQIRTRDGDLVTIDISREAAWEESTFHSEDAQRTVNGFQSSESLSENRRISVTGDLDEGELAAIEDLVAQVDDLAATFFDGDVKQAFAATQNLGFDAGELSGFKLDLEKTETQYAVQSREAVFLTPPPREGSLDMKSFAERALGRLDALMEGLEEMDIFHEPRSTVAALLEALAQDREMREQGEGEERLSPSQFLGALMDNYLEGLEKAPESQA